MRFTLPPPFGRRAVPYPAHPRGLVDQPIGLRGNLECAASVAWGSVAPPDQRDIEWGVICQPAVCDTSEAWTTWGSATGSAENVVWGVSCGGGDCAADWTVETVGSTVISESNADTIVWGTSSDADTIVWGTAAADDTIVWGTSCSDACQPVIWNQQ